MRFASAILIFLALLGKQLGVTPFGWREVAGQYGEKGSHRSIADVTDETSLNDVRTFKKTAKAAAKSQQPPPPEARPTRMPTQFIERVAVECDGEGEAVLMIHGGFRHMPIVDGDEVVGMLSIRDLMRLVLEDSRAKKSRMKPRLGQLMTQKGGMYVAEALKRVKAGEGRLSGPRASPNGPFTSRRAKPFC